MNTTSAAIETPTTSLTTCSDSFTAMSAPSADVRKVKMPMGTRIGRRNMPARANRAVADTVMNSTANMLVATACRGAMPTVIITGTFTSELPPVIAPMAPVASMMAVKIAIRPGVTVR